jgi:16S rRNA (cytosine967-C5)-methyltransferase
MASPKAPTDKLSPAWIDAAGALYLEGVRAAARRSAGLDRTVAAFLKSRRDLDEDGRGFVVDTAQGMMRARARLDAAVEQLGYEPTRAALACLFLVGARGADGRALPIDPRGIPALAAAWRATEGAPLAVRASIPPWLADELSRTRESAEALCLSFSETPPLALRVNRLRTSVGELVAALAAEGLAAAPGALSPDAVVLARRANVFRTRAFREGDFEVQDEGSQLVSRVCEAKPGMVVIDGCAGAGGKTLHLSALMEGRGTLYAFDTSRRRLEDLRERARRAGAHNLRVQAVDDRRGVLHRERLRGTADVVLVDAPCSGTGVLRRNPDTSWRLTPGDVERMRGQQAQILEDHAPLVKPGGRLVYATCSLLSSENEGTVEAFLGSHPEFTMRRADEILESQGIRVPGVGDVLSLDPLRHGTDGFYAAVLVRAASSRSMSEHDEP